MRGSARMHAMFNRVFATLAIGLLPVLAACVPGEALPSTCGEPAVTITATLSGDHLDPTNLDACRDQHVTLKVASELSGDFHLHGYDDQVPETEISKGETLTLEFDAVRSGQFPIELHPADGSDEFEIGTFTVHEP